MKKKPYRAKKAKALGLHCVTIYCGDNPARGRIQNDVAMLLKHDASDAEYMFSYKVNHGLLQVAVPTMGQALAVRMLGGEFVVETPFFYQSHPSTNGRGRNVTFTLVAD
jgi:hypothetical protein